jgi:hypothetical protein
MQEAEIRRILFQNQSQANSSPDPILKIPNAKKGWWSDSNDESACLEA